MGKTEKAIYHLRDAEETHHSGATTKTQSHHGDAEARRKAKSTLKIATQRFREKTRGRREWNMLSAVVSVCPFLPHFFFMDGLDKMDDLD